MYALARYTCNERASVRDRRDGCAPFFHPSSWGGIHFAAQRPRLLRTAPPFDCFDYPYLIPRSSSLQPFPDHYRSLRLSLDLDSPFSFRDIKKHPYTSRRCVPRGGPAIAKIHRIYSENADGSHLRSGWSILEIHERKGKEIDLN